MKVTFSKLYFPSYQLELSLCEIVRFCGLKEIILNIISHL